MTKFISGKKYSTDQAKKIAEASVSKPGKDGYRHEELYLKKTGEFFLYGKGGYKSPYATFNGTDWEIGEKVVPLDYEAARVWAIDNMYRDEFDIYFGKHIEANPLGKRVHITIRSENYEKGKKYAAQHNTTLSDLIDAYLSSLNLID